MSELGQFLKKAREERNLSLNDIQEVTKIRKRYLEAIEVGDYQVLPGQFYARAFIKSYAEVLGLDPEEIYQQFSNELPSVPKAPMEAVVHKRKKDVRSTSSPKIGKWISRLVFYAFLLLVGFVIWYAAVQYFETAEDDPLESNQQGHIDTEGVEPDPEDGTPTNEEREEAEEVDPPANEEPELEPTWTRIGTEGRTTTFEYADADRMEITLQAVTGDVWYSLTAPAENLTIVNSETISRESERSWDLSEHEQVQFHIGDSRSMALLINGEEVDTSDIPQGHYLLIHFIPASEG